MQFCCKPVWFGVGGLMKHKPVLWIFGIVLCTFYGVIASGQILGFTRLYEPFLAIPLSIVLAGVIFYFYIRKSNQFFDSFDHTIEIQQNTGLTAAFLITGLLVYILLVFFPLVHWPYSPISIEIPWDAGVYHFPKAAEMISTGSAWDLSISYGEYPFGYESLIAMSLLLNRSGFLIGTVHALISLYLLLSLGLLISQRTRIPRAPILFMLGILFLGTQLAPNFESNIWWVFWPQITLIGKNDVFLAAALLAVLLHTPISRQGPFFPFGLAVASMVALSIKPTAGVVVLFSWLVMLIFMWRAKLPRSSWNQLLLSGLIIFPGILWAIRNLVAQGALFSTDSSVLASWSIVNNLSNPYFYENIPQHLYIIISIISLAGLVSVFKRSLRFELVSVFVLLVTFALTPASAFFGSTQERAQIGWRFALALLAYILVIMMAVLEPIINRVYRWIAQTNYVAATLAFIVLVFGGWCVWTQRDLLATYPKNEIVLHDQYRQPVGVGGYYSAYDFVQKNVHHSIVIIENGYSYYLYDPGFTNSITRSRTPDYYVWLQTPWINGGGYPDTLNQSDWLQTWQLVYEDTQGRVYKHR
jgi:hypothetical protein